MAGFSVRPALPSDAAAIARVHVDAWRETYRGLMPDKILDDLTYEKREKNWGASLPLLDERRQCCFVATAEAGAIVGFVMAGPTRAEHPSFTGEIYAIYLLRAFHGRGLGKQLFLSASSWLGQNGFPSFLLWVLTNNSTRGFYEAMGGEPCGEKTELIGEPLEHVGYGWQRRD